MNNITRGKNNLQKRIIHVMRTIVEKHDNKQPVFICTDFETRNRYKNNKYKISHKKPQCPVFKDNRCCGSCNLASSCEHAVNCGCYGYAKAQLGGNDESYYMHKASMYYKHGRIKKDGSFDWDFYNLNNFVSKIYIGGYLRIELDEQSYYAEIKSKVCPKSNEVELYIRDIDIHVKRGICDLKDYSIYSKKQAEMYKIKK